MEDELNKRTESETDQTSITISQLSNPAGGDNIRIMEDITVDWTPSFDYKTLAAQEIEEYSNIEVTKDLREGGKHAQKAWDYWFRYLSVNVWKTSLNAEVVSFCNSIKNPRILSLGCGYGGHELAIARELKKPFQIIAVDLNGNLFSKAIQEAKKDDFDICFKALDLNFVHIVENSYDLIFAHASLHHLLNLEHVFLQIYKGLKENGRFVVQDVIGKTQVLFWKENVDCAIDIVSQMPERYKAGISDKEPIIAPYVEPSVQKGMEGIRQEEIPGLLELFFTPIKYFPFGAVMRLICTNPQLGKHFDPDKDEDRTYLEKIFQTDIELVKEGKLRPTEMLGVYIKRPRIDTDQIFLRAKSKLDEILQKKGESSPIKEDPDNEDAIFSVEIQE
jgi:SAM-dependent methyltransferase